MAVHGQADQLRLRQPAAQKETLDRFAGPAVNDLLTCYLPAHRRLADIDRRLDTRRREADEIAAAAPAPDEDEALRQEEDRLAHAEGLQRAATAARSAIAGEDEQPVAPADALGLLAAARAASGGELSRVMLALEVVLAATTPVPTYVFDEVDAGIGGKAAVEVGRRLSRLARNAQVLAVTHLPQVAAFADRHYLVDKSDDGTVTTSGVRALNGTGRVRELSRMLAGLEGSATAAAHAQELLELAAGDG